MNYATDALVWNDIQTYTLQLYDVKQHTYYAAASFINYLIKEYGREEVYEYLFADVLSNIDGKDFEALSSEWEQYIKITYVEYQPYIVQAE